jgi:NAD(P)-dependent dehydrogenase (short-subunit alcohol dehydrogenase family)
MSEAGATIPRAALLERFSLAGKVAVVTGASSGLGAAFAAGLAEAGADVAIGARRVDRLAETARAIEGHGRRSLAVGVDVTRPEDCERFVGETVEALGKVDILINNAGLGSSHPATREDPDDFRAVIDVNLMGVYWMAQACGRVMGPGSAILNISSILGLTTAGLPQAAYCSSKSAILGLTRDLAQQWSGRKGIRVNALAPGFFPSEMADVLDGNYLAGQLRRAPLGRAGDPPELVAAAVFLCSDAASYVTGAVLPVDGGLLTA